MFALSGPSTTPSTRPDALHSDTKCQHPLRPATETDRFHPVSIHRHSQIIPQKHSYRQHEHLRRVHMRVRVGGKGLPEADPKVGIHTYSSSRTLYDSPGCEKYNLANSSDNYNPPGYRVPMLDVCAYSGHSMYRCRFFTESCITNDSPLLNALPTYMKSSKFFSQNSDSAKN